MKWCSTPPTRYPNMVTYHGISIIGAGRLGRSVGRSLRERGWKIHSVVTRSHATARRAVRSIGGGHARAAISSEVFLAPIILIAVPDSAIPHVVQQLAAVGDPDARKRSVLHTSGTLSSGVLAPLRQLGATVGSVHPLQSFSGVSAPSLEGRVFAIEGDVAAVRAARSLARTLGGQIVLLASAGKPLYHAAASMAAGQVLAQVEAAIQIFASLGMKRREALRALLPLTRQVLENQERLGSRAAWTGPLARGDFRVIAEHEKALLSCSGEYLAAYRAMNRLAARVLSREPESVLAALDQISHESAYPLQAKGVTA
jgi:predicted short-subunit dehydrogenase-like oxidoreductase (DUF2520 family)